MFWQNEASWPPTARRLAVEAPPEWAGRTILHLTDLHLIPGRGDGKRIAAGVQGRRCDALAITGDILEHEDAVEDLIQIVDAIDCRGPRLAVLGNHDLHGDRSFKIAGHHRVVEHFKGFIFRSLIRAIRSLQVERPERRPDEHERIRAAIERLGVKVLHNESTEIGEWRDAWVLGVGDPYSGSDDLPGSLATLPPGARPLGLVHAPPPAPHMVSAGSFLVLCGHTHGNQIRLPGSDHLLGLGALDWQPRRGVFQRTGGTIVVSSGAGHLVPLRLGVPPEIWEIDLIASSPRQTSRNPQAVGAGLA